MLFTKLKEDILGKDYSLSLAFVSRAKSRELNKKYRRKDRPTNVLSFSLRKNTGELVLCKPVIRQEAKETGRNLEEYLTFLVIHGLLHLKGMEHSSTMTKAEDFYLAKYDQKYFNGNRRRVHDNPGRRGRVLQRRKKS